MRQAGTLLGSRAMQLGPTTTPPCGVQLRSASLGLGQLAYVRCVNSNCKKLTAVCVDVWVGYSVDVLQLLTRAPCLKCLPGPMPRTARSRRARALNCSCT